MNNRLLNRHRDERGVALILTLAILVLVTILVVAFAISMRIENSAALAFSDQIRAREMALAGIDAAVMQLRTATPQITPTTSYITAPGLILTRTNGVGFSVSMYSMGANGSCDLNAGARITGITTTNITANWINYTWGQPGLVGRYAYWVDDDASKVNINTAKQRGDPLGSTPTNIDLRVFGASVQPNTSYTTATSAGYPTERSWPMGSSSAISTQDCMNGIFNITAYSANTKLTPWGAPCFNLNQSYSLPSDLVTNIAAYLQNPNLTNLFPMTFAQKYGSNCLQIAANIVAYRVPRTTVVDSLGNPPTYLGLQRTPYLNELIVSNSFRVATNVLGQLMVQMDSTTYVELWYMYPSISYPLTSHSVTLYNQPSIKFSSGQTKTFPNPNALSGITGVMVPVVGNFGVYTALVVSAEKYAFTNANLSDVTVTFNSGMVTGVFQKVLPLQRFDYAHIPMTNHTYTLKAAMAGAPDFFNPVTNLIWGSASIDPRCRPVNTYWNCLGGGTTFVVGTLGGWNSGSYGQGGAYNTYRLTNTVLGCSVPLVSDSVITGNDADWSCHTNIGSVAGSPIKSLGELGYIHTGVPWRTLCMGPAPVSETNSIPDWAMLDLFTTTNEPVAGRININDTVYIVYPFQWLYPSPSQLRQDVLIALVTNTSLASLNVADIQNRNWNNSIRQYRPISNWGTLNVFGTIFTNSGYSMVGEICEVAGVADGVANKKSIREAGVRAIANLITTRSSTFSIWAIGQAIVDVNADGNFDAGTDIVIGEVVVHAVVERYEDLAAPAGKQVKFRIKYLHYLTN